MASRLDSYKSKGLLRSDDLRRRREDQQVEIRRQKRDESNAKRRQMTLNVADLTDDDEEDEDAVGSLLEVRSLHPPLPPPLFRLRTADLMSDPA